MISFANGALITRHLIACEFLGPSIVHSQLIRWKRKPIWLGTAKSKIFRIPKRPVIPVEDVQELKRLNNNYRTYRESIRRYFMDLTKQNMVEYDEETLRRAEEKDFAHCSRLNDEWNKEVAKSREARTAKEFEERKAEVLRNMIAKEKRDAKLMKEVEAKVKEVKAVAHTFITESNIDQAIEEALANVVNYNVAIDSDGNKYVGKYVPVEQESLKKERLQAGQ